MTYGHCLPLYLGTENSSRTGDVSGERGAHGSRVHWRGVSLLYIEMCRGRNHVKIGLYTFDKDKIPYQSPIHTREYLNTGDLKFVTVRTPSMYPSCVVSYVHCLEISSRRRSSRSEMKRRNDGLGINLSSRATRAHPRDPAFHQPILGFNAFR
jgi:hypothetical protein